MPSAPDPTLGPLGVVLLAILQGLAEFLPISSSGHLVLARAAWGVREAGLALDISLHLGTLAAVLWGYRREVGEILNELRRGKGRMILWLFLGSLPAATLGLGFRQVFRNAAELPHYAAGGLLTTAVILCAGEWGRRRRGPLSGEPSAGLELATPNSSLETSYGVPRWGDAVIIGFAQALALFPGISRSGSTLSAGLLRGLDVQQSARLSFLLSIPAILGAAVLELPDAMDHGLGGVNRALLLLGIAVAAVTGLAALRTLVLTVARGAFLWFAGYCALVGAGAMAWYGLASAAAH